MARNVLGATAEAANPDASLGSSARSARRLGWIAHSGARVPNGAGWVGKVHVLPGSGGPYGGSFLTLLTGNEAYEVVVTCKYSSPSDNKAFFYAVRDGHSAAAYTVVDSKPVQFFPSIPPGAATAFAVLPSRPWHGVFTIDEGGVLTRWEVTVAELANGDCTALVYGTGSLGPQTVSQ